MREVLARSPEAPAGADKRFIGELVDAGEWEIALDFLCSQLDEYDLPVSPSLRSDLDALGEGLGVDVARYFRHGPPEQGEAEPVDS